MDDTTTPMDGEEVVEVAEPTTEEATEADTEETPEEEVEA